MLNGDAFLGAHEYHLTSRYAVVPRIQLETTCGAGQVEDSMIIPTLKGGLALAQLFPTIVLLVI